MIVQKFDGLADAPKPGGAVLPRDFLTLAELQKLIPVTRRTFYTWRKQGWLPAVDTGGKLLFHWPSVEAALLRRQKGGCL